MKPFWAMVVCDFPEELWTQQFHTTHSTSDERCDAQGVRKKAFHCSFVRCVHFNTPQKHFLSDRCQCFLNLLSPTPFVEGNAFRNSVGHVPERVTHGGCERSITQLSASSSLHQASEEDHASLRRLWLEVCRSVRRDVGHAEPFLQEVARRGCRL